MNNTNNCFQKIFLTGGTGFFGKSILDMLKRGFKSNTEFVILSRDPQRFLRTYPQYGFLSNVRFIRGDVLDFDFPQEKFDSIIHAATPAVTTLAPGEMRHIIIGGTQRVLEFAKFCGAEKLLFTSSGAVYGPQGECHNVPEDFPCNPVTEYGIAKLDAEKLCVDSGVPSYIARCFAFVGPHLARDIHFAIGNFIGNALQKEDIIIKGDGTAFRSYLYADDLVEWLFAILERGKAGRPYNVGSPHGLSIADLAKEVSRCFGNTSKIQILTSPTPGAPVSRYVPDTSRAEKELGLQVKIPLAKAIDLSWQ